MLSAIVHKELKIHWRSGVFLAVAAALTGLIVMSVILSVQRVAAFERERASAVAADRAIWDGQGVKNPHGAAHFARYAFRPTPTLAAFDPGVSDYAGMALWMEAHYQNPAVFRRAEERGDTGWIASLSPAWILRTMTPLFIFLVLFGAIAGERESGTLRQTAALGVGPRVLAAGKLAGAALGLGVVIAPVLAGALLVAARAGGAVTLEDNALRIAGLTLTYGVFLFAVGATAIGVSALCRDRRGALIALVSIWAVSFVFTPRLAGDIAVSAHPEPDAGALAASLQKAARGLGADAEAMAALPSEAMAEYGVERMEDLPINFIGYRLQRAEEYAHDLFAEVYGRLGAVHDAQERILGAASLISPVMAVKRLSGGLAGVDRLHQQAFIDDAEAHRREMIGQLNRDFMINGADAAGAAYTADEKLWRRIEDFDHGAVSFKAVAGRYRSSALVLLAYLLGSIVFVRWAVARAQKRVIQS
ncbi:DUF3526 domain-containing protein [Eilatimonas milleporae]|uniref:ABC-2 type transport system permease protein n=1 Tax=Eilatimonas milleporae TaxID=911205 RepID=A0A3M0BZB0_9PROT|nr:DUF3526 domain-containing protein [Eilatimonas milleporae]RMB02921.1 ABC-2 type transport system permease protein [Eilatimonas milleporae]